jgi:hypothetical protein
MRESLDVLAHLVVPSIADWAVVDLLHRNGTVERVAIAHRNPSAIQDKHKPLGVIAEHVEDECDPLAAVLLGKPAMLMDDFHSDSALSSTSIPVPRTGRRPSNHGTVASARTHSGRSYRCPHRHGPAIH